MFNLGFSELIFLGIIALIFIGPKELPEIARVIGRFLNELRRASSDLQETLMDAKPDFTKELNEYHIPEHNTKPLAEPIDRELARKTGAVEHDPDLEARLKLEAEKKAATEKENSSDKKS